MIDHRHAALEALDDEDYEVAEQHLRSVLADDPDDGVAAALLALVLLAPGRLDDALTFAERAVAVTPQAPFAHYALGNVLLARNRFRPALAAALDALRLDPDESDYHALAARAHAALGAWDAALESASKGLAIDPEHVPSANVRALALRHLGRTEEADAAFADVAAAAPLDTFATAGRAWTLLRAGNRDDALEQFREALRLDPSNEWARDGMLSSFKARNPVYRVFLQYYLWIGTRTRQQQVVFAVVGILLYSNMRRLARAQPELAPVLWPLMGLYILFILGSWIADPLFDLLLRFDAVGRRALTPERRRASAWIGASLLVAVVAAIAALVTRSSSLILLAMSAGFLLIPLAGTFRCEPGWPRTVMGSYTAALAATAVVAMTVPESARGPLFVIVMLGAAIASWLTRWLETVIPAR